MSLLPEDQVADHITKVLGMYHESGLPAKTVWQAIDARDATRFILKYVPYEDAMKVDVELITDSWRLARAKGKNWGPWYIGNAIQDKSQMEHKERLDAKIENDRTKAMVDSVANARHAEAEAEAHKKSFDAFREGLSSSDVRAIMGKWRTRLGTEPPTGLALKWEYAEREKAQQ